MKMKRAIYYLAKELRGNIYYSLINYAKNYCDTILLVIRNSVWIEPTVETILKQLEQFLKSKVSGSEWPGTRLFYGATATIYRYKLCPESAEILKGAADGLYNWVQPELPEDICLLRSDDSHWLVTISHEKESYLMLTPEEKDYLLKIIPELKDFLRVSAL